MYTGIKQAGSYGKGRFRTVQIQAEFVFTYFHGEEPGDACAVHSLQSFTCSRPAASTWPVKVYYQPSLITGKTDQGVVNNWGFCKSPSCTELQFMDFKNKLRQSGRYLLVQEVTQREFNWIHPKWIGQESRSSVSAKVSHQHLWGMSWPGVCLGAALNAFQLQDGFLPHLSSLQTSHQAGCIANSSWKACLPQ